MVENCLLKCNCFVNQISSKKFTNIVKEGEWGWGTVCNILPALLYLTKSSAKIKTIFGLVL